MKRYNNTGWSTKINFNYSFN